jgi:tetratricopeptide (TPR) repeat protein
MTISAYKEIERLRELAKELPLLGLDPARARKKADHALALSLCDKLLDAYPKLAAARHYRAMFSLHNEDFDLAAQECQIAQTLNPDNLENLLLKGNIFYVANDLKSAAAAFRQVTEEFADDARGWYALGKVLLDAGAKLEAIAAYLAALERAPVILEAETNLQTLLESAEAPSLLARLKNNKPDIYPAAAVYYAFWKNTGQRLGDLAEKTMEEFPNLYLGYYMQGLLAGAQQQYGEAAALFQACLALRPSFPEVHRELGLLNLSNDRCTEGERHITLYVRTANFVDDYAVLERQIERCKKRK